MPATSSASRRSDLQYTALISRSYDGKMPNGPFPRRPTCVGFLSSASNIVGGDTNGVDDAFVKSLRRGAPKRLLPGGRQSAMPATAIAVSGDCKYIAFVTGGKLYVKRGGGR